MTKPKVMKKQTTARSVNMKANGASIENLEMMPKNPKEQQ